MTTTGVYNQYKDGTIKGSVAFLTDTIRVLLVDATYVFDPDDDFVAAVAGAEVAGAGYARQTLAGKTVTRDNALDLAYADATDLTYVAANFGTPFAAIVYKFVTNDADSPLICCVNLNPHTLTNGSNFVVQWAATGIFQGA